MSANSCSATSNSGETPFSRTKNITIKSQGQLIPKSNKITFLEISQKPKRSQKIDLYWRVQRQKLPKISCDLFDKGLKMI